MEKHQEEIYYRKGLLADCHALATLIDMAAGGTVDYLFHNLMEDMTPVQIVAHSMARNHYPHGYETAIVAAQGDTVAGMALSFPARFHGITKEMEDFFPPDRLAHMAEFFSTRVEDSWFLDALGVFPDYHRRGIGRRLIELAKAKAVENGCEQLSLMVFADNDTAITLYEHTGFRVVKTVGLPGNDRIPHEGGCLLMVCDLSI